MVRSEKSVVLFQMGLVTIKFQRWENMMKELIDDVGRQ